MASKIQKPEPVCLIKNKKGKGLVVQPGALQLLSEITQPMVVVAIAGPYRSGKSYLLNRLAGQRRGFSLGSSVRAHTKGIWIWCVPHPCKPGYALVLLDTEGLGDTEKGDTENDTWIFVLAVLLSSTLIYNSKGTIDQQAMDNLHYVLKLSECVQVKTAPKEAGAVQAGEEQPGSDRRALFFPTFIWAVRDFTLQLEVDGKEISEDEYLENALKLKDGSSQEAQSYNRLRECIRQLFPERKCFVFDQPARKKDLPRLEELPDNMLDPEFQQQEERFCSYIGQNCPPKTIPGGHEITGSRLGTLVVSYVEAIQRGAVPCLESAVLALAEIENSAALKEAVALYQSQMEQGLPTETTQELLELHARCEEEAKRLFTARAFEESRERFQAELTVQLEALKEHFWMRNERVSHEKCTAALQELFQDLDRRINDGVYFMLGGYQLFQRDQQALVEQYRKLPGKGVKADAALQDFLQKRESMARTILKVDHELTEKEEQIENLKAQYERAEQEREAERKRLDETEVENQKTLLKLLSDMKARWRKKREEKENKNDHQSKEQDKKSTSGSEKKSNPEDQQNSKPGGKSDLKAQYERAEQEREAERKRLDETEVENQKTLLKLLNDMKARQRKKREEKENENDHQSKEQDNKSTSGSEKKSNPEDQQNSKPGGKSDLKAQYERAEQEREAERKRLVQRKIKHLETLLKLLSDMEEHESFRDGKPRQRKKPEEKENKNDHQSKDQDNKSTSGSEKKSNPEDQQNSKPGGKSGDGPRYNMWFELLEKMLKAFFKW